jgi:glutamine synthetase
MDSNRLEKNVKLEYIWLDGDENEPALRSKTKVMDIIMTIDDHINFDTFLKKIPEWSFDGSSTMQAEGNKSDCILKPVKIINDPTRKTGYLVMCEVMNTDGTAHVSNKRDQVEEYEDGEMWFGFEQEYVINNPETGKPIGFPKGVNAYPNPQGQYYCGVGNVNVKARSFVEDHMDLCLKAGLGITGVNGEVMIGQWEYQLFGKGEKSTADDLWLSRYILQRLGEEYGLNVTLHPKPVKGDWNGSGMHCNFSSKRMRELDIVPEIYKVFEESHEHNIEYYGAYNELRLTGLHETQHIEDFTYGVGDRGASIRIPVNTARDGKGYLEDRRPASNADPYDLVDIISRNVKEAEKKHIS